MAGVVAGLIIKAAGVAAGSFLAGAIKVGVGLAFSAVSRVLQKKQGNGVGRAPGIRNKYTGQGDISPQSIILGRYATGGHRICPFYAHSKDPGSGSDYGAIGHGDYATFIINIADAPMSGLHAIYVDGTEFVVGQHLSAPQHPAYGMAVASGQDRDDWVGRVWVKFYDGHQTTPDPYLRAAYGAHPDRPWKASSIHRGGAYAIVTVKRDDKLFRGVPRFRFVVDGMALPDPRTSQTGLTHNAMTLSHAVLTGIDLPDGQRFGVGASLSDLPPGWWDVAQDVSDEPVPAQGGGTEPQYRAGIEIAIATPDDGGSDPLSVLDDLLPAASAEIADLGGTWIVRAGPSGPAILSISDDDILNSRERSYRPFEGLAETHNMITATFPNPDAKWEATEAPARVDEDAVARDGQRLPANLDLDAVPYGDQVQRLMQSWLKDAARQRAHVIALPPSLDRITVLDTIQLTSERHGYVNKLFEVQQYTPDLKTGVVTVVIREVDPADYIPDAASYEPQPVTLTARQKAAALVINDFAVEPYTISDGGSRQRPAIKVDWTLPGGNLDGVSWRVMQGANIVADGAALGADATGVVISDGLIGDTLYTVVVKPITALQDADWSPPKTVTTPDVGLRPEDMDDAVWQQVDTAATARAQTVLDGFRGTTFADTQTRLEDVRARAQGVATDLRHEVERLAEDATRALLDKSTSDARMFDAGLRIDPDTGSAYLEGIAQHDGRFTEVEARIAAAEGLIQLSATTIWVNQQIAAAVLDPADLASLDDVWTQINSVTSTIDSINASLTDKASTVTTDALGVSVTSAQTQLDALAAEVSALVTSGEFSAIQTQLQAVQQSLSTLDVPTLSQHVFALRQQADETDRLAEQGIAAMLDGYNRGDYLQASIASAKQDLSASIDENGTAIASLRAELVASVAGTTALITQESTARADGDAALAASISEYQAQTDTSFAGYQSSLDLLAGQNSAQASQIASLTATQGDHTTQIQTQAQAVAGLGGTVQYLVNTNGHIAGWALTNQIENGAPFAAFTFLADQFQISGASGAYSPFVVYTAPTNVGGTVVPAGVYLRDAFIRYGAIGSAQIGNLAVDEIHIKNGAVTEFDEATGSDLWQHLSGHGYAVLLTKAVEVHGGRVVIMMDIDDTASVTSRSVPAEDPGGADVVITARPLYRLRRDGQQISGQFRTNTIKFDHPPTGTVTYTLEAMMEGPVEGPVTRPSALKLNIGHRAMIIQEIKK